MHSLVVQQVSLPKARQVREIGIPTLKGHFCLAQGHSSPRTMWAPLACQSGSQSIPFPLFSNVDKSHYLVIPSFLYIQALPIKPHNVTMWQTGGSVCFGLVERHQTADEDWGVQGEWVGGWSLACKLQDQNHLKGQTAVTVYYLHPDIRIKVSHCHMRDAL